MNRIFLSSILAALSFAFVGTSHSQTMPSGELTQLQNDEGSLRVKLRELRIRRDRIPGWQVCVQSPSSGPFYEGSPNQPVSSGSCFPGTAWKARRLASSITNVKGQLTSNLKRQLDIRSSISCPKRPKWSKVFDTCDSRKSRAKAKLREQITTLESSND